MLMYLACSVYLVSMTLCSPVVLMLFKEVLGSVKDRRDNMVLSAEMRASAWVILIAEELGCGKSSLTKAWLCKAEVASVPNLKDTRCSLLPKGKDWGETGTQCKTNAIVPVCLMSGDSSKAQHIPVGPIWICLPR